MLNLSRRRGQSVVLMLPGGREVWVRYLGRDADGGVRLGVDAPQDVCVLRSELHDEEHQGGDAGEGDGTARGNSAE
jgi:sRNA-binding carbon storage regulator CsrA